MPDCKSASQSWRVPPTNCGGLSSATSSISTSASRWRPLALTVLPRVEVKGNSAAVLIEARGGDTRQPRQSQLAARDTVRADWEGAERPGPGGELGPRKLTCGRCEWMQARGPTLILDDGGPEARSTKQSIVAMKELYVVPAVVSPAPVPARALPPRAHIPACPCSPRPASSRLLAPRIAPPRSCLLVCTLDMPAASLWSSDGQAAAVRGRPIARGAPPDTGLHRPGPWRQQPRLVDAQAQEGGWFVPGGHRVPAIRSAIQHLGGAPGGGSALGRPSRGRVRVWGLGFRV